MNEHVSSDTAILLRDTGFPIPEFEAGQHWYGEDLVVILSYGGGNPEFRAYGDNFSWRESFDLDVFAPTATDILKELPGARLEFGIDCHTKSGESWSCEKFSHETNPAEAAALAWLHAESVANDYVQRLTNK